MYQRRLERLVRRALADTPVVLLAGARQTGKSTLAQNIAQGPDRARYLSLDDLGVLSAAKNDPQGFLSALEGPAVLDEVQRAEELFLPLKAEVDKDRRPGRFLLTGSANALFLPGLSRALVGRMEVMTLWPLSQSELEGTAGGFVDALFDPRSRPPAAGRSSSEAPWKRVAAGGFPEALARKDPARRAAWFESYVNTLLQRDVRDLSQVEGLTQMPRLLRLLAARTASLMNSSELSRSTGIPQTTLKRYLALMEATLILHRLPPWSGNLGKRLVKSPKLFLVDPGLTAALLGLDAGRIGAGEMAGPLLESFVFSELSKQAAWSRARPRLHHFRTQTGFEVDFLLEDARGRLAGVEVKASASVSSRDFKGLRAAAESLGRRFARGVVLYTGRETVSFAKNLHALPIDALWSC